MANELEQRARHIEVLRDWKANIGGEGTADEHAALDAAIAALQQAVPDAVDLEQFRGAVSLLHLTCRRRIRDVRKGVFPAHYLPIFEQDLAQASALLDLIDSQQESRK